MGDIKFDMAIDGLEDSSPTGSIGPRPAIGGPPPSGGTTEAGHTGDRTTPTRWQDHSACRGVDPALFFPIRGETAGAAKAFCAICPVREQSLEYALINNEEVGIWGGTSERQRRRMRQDRGIGPRRRRPNPDAAQHGTAAGYKRHRRAGEDSCEASLAANRLTTQMRTEKVA
jgi:WhiB family redox-sensing transcriptional regulator